MSNIVDLAAARAARLVKPSSPVADPRLLEYFDQRLRDGVLSILWANDLIHDFSVSMEPTLMTLTLDLDDNVQVGTDGFIMLAVRIGFYFIQPIGYLREIHTHRSNGEITIQIIYNCVE